MNDIISERRKVLKEKIRLAGINNNHSGLKEAKARLDELDNIDAALNGENEDSLESKKVDELRQMASELGVEGYSSMRKAELIDVLRSE